MLRRYLNRNKGLNIIFDRDIEEKIIDCDTVKDNGIGIEEIHCRIS